MGRVAAEKILFTIVAALTLWGCGGEEQGGATGATEGSNQGSTTVAAVEGDQELTPIIGG